MAVLDLPFNPVKKLSADRSCKEENHQLSTWSLKRVKIFRFQAENYRSGTDRIGEKFMFAAIIYAQTALSLLHVAVSFFQRAN